MSTNTFLNFFTEEILRYKSLLTPGKPLLFSNVVFTCANFVRERDYNAFFCCCFLLSCGEEKSSRRNRLTVMRIDENCCAAVARRTTFDVIETLRDIHTIWKGKQIFALEHNYIDINFIHAAHKIKIFF